MGIEEHNAKKEILRLDTFLSEPVLLIGGLAVQQYFAGRTTKDLDLVCSLDQQKAILSAAYPLEEYEVDESQNDLRPSIVCHNRTTDTKIFLGPKILEREPYKFINYSYFLEDAISYSYDGQTTANIFVPAAHVLAFSKILSFISRRGKHKGRQDLSDFSNLSNSKLFSLSRFNSFVDRSKARDYISKFFLTNTLTEEEITTIKKSSPARFYSIMPIFWSSLQTTLKSSATVHQPTNTDNQEIAVPKSETIGIVAPISSWATDYYIQIIRAIRTASLREIPDLQRKVIVFDVFREDHEHVQAIIGDAIRAKLSGLITINCSVPAIVSPPDRPLDIPIVSITHADTSLPYSCSIMPDHKPFGALCEKLILSNHAPSAIFVSKPLKNPFNGTQQDRTRSEKREAFRKACNKGKLQNLCIELKETNVLTSLDGRGLVIEVDIYDYETGRHVAELISDHLLPNTAIICMADNVALGVIDALSRKRPDWKKQNIRISGFDNSREARTRDLTSVDYCLETVGLVAYQRLQALIANPTISYAEEQVPVKVFERGSTA